MHSHELEKEKKAIIEMEQKAAELVVNCPITLESITQTKDIVVVAPDGHVYTDKALKEALEKKQASPMTREPMKFTDGLYKNYGIKNVVNYTRATEELIQKQKSYIKSLENELKKTQEQSNLGHLIEEAVAGQADKINALIRGKKLLPNKKNSDLEAAIVKQKTVIAANIIKKAWLSYSNRKKIHNLLAEYKKLTTTNDKLYAAFRIEQGEYIQTLQRTTLEISESPTIPVEEVLFGKIRQLTASWRKKDLSFNQQKALNIAQRKKLRADFFNQSRIPAWQHVRQSLVKQSEELARLNAKYINEAIQRAAEVKQYSTQLTIELKSSIDKLAAEKLQEITHWAENESNQAAAFANQLQEKQLKTLSIFGGIKSSQERKLLDEKVRPLLADNKKIILSEEKQKELDKELLFAITNEHTCNYEKVHDLLKRGANPNKMSSDLCFNSPLAALAGWLQFNSLQLKIASLLFNHNVNVNIQNSYGDSALHWAVFRKNISLVKLLMEYGANPELKNGRGLTPLNESKPPEEIVEILKKSQPKKNSSEHKFFTRYQQANFDEDLISAICDRNYERIKALLAAGANPNIQKFGASWDYTPIIWFASLVEGGSENLKFIRVFLEHGATVNATTKNKDTALHWAAYRKNEAIVRLLLQFGADPTLANVKGKTPLTEQSNLPQAIIMLLRSQPVPERSLPGASR